MAIKSYCTRHRSAENSAERCPIKRSIPAWILRKERPLSIEGEAGGLLRTFGENGFPFSGMAEMMDAQDQADTKEEGEDRAAARAEEGESDAENRQQPDGHPDVDHRLEADQRHHAHAYELPRRL